jgi:hypothetical protein
MESRESRRGSCPVRGRRIRAAGTALSIAATVTGGLCAAPALAQSITVGQACYVNTNPFMGATIAVTGQGWTPNDSIELVGSGMDGTATAGATGSFATTLQGPVLESSAPGQERFTLTATDETTAAASAATSFYAANLAFGVSPSSAPFDRKVNFSFSGFDPGKLIYAHYLHGRRLIASQAFGRAGGVCGMRRDRAYQYPGGHPKYRSFTVQFDDSRHYAHSARPRITSSLSVL